jgi:mannose-6-phosphate isomerase-like protein (cupin superfamily)
MLSPDLDALVAAPDHHRLAYEDDRVRVLETIIQPGDKTPLHTHSYPGTLYALSGSDFVRRDAECDVILDSRSAGICIKSGEAMWSGALGPHTLENVGRTPIHIIATEVKSDPIRA